MSNIQDVRKVIKSELIKAKTQKAHFFKKYAWIQHPVRGKVPFILYPYQGKVINIWDKERYSIINKSRQLGITTLVAGYSLHTLLFNSDKNILAIATKQETAKNIVTKVKFMYDSLPKWMQIDTVENNKLTLRFKNGSQIKAVSAAGDAGRSEAVSLLLIDEAAFIDNVEQIFTSAQMTLATGGKCIVLSTPFGVGNWFHRMWTEAQQGLNRFTPIELPWYVHPDRNEEWRKEQDEILTPKQAAQECDCDFLASGNTVFENEDMLYYEETCVEPPKEKTGIDGNYWLWQQPDFSRKYMVVADVARGDGTDYSTCHVFDVETFDQVAEYKGKLPPKDFGNFLVGVGAQWNDALLVIENTSIGWACIEQVMSRQYKNLYHSPRTGDLTPDEMLKRVENDQTIPGFTMSSKTRPLVIAKLQEAVRDKIINFKSKRTTEEMRVFIWNNGKPQAQDSYNDDLIIPAAIAAYVREIALHIKQISDNTTRAVLRTINKYNDRTKNPRFSSHNNYNQGKKQWNIKDQHGNDQDISWLI